ncbi:MAG: Acyl-CoA dehydrogenase, C-terminal domain [Frankiales bacterium]|nr:Acyl-CoA dehydrogenase, C-terminal domain [Frankiales bacterium]
MASTHDVTNQAPPLVGHDLAEDAALLSGLEREGAGWYADDLHRVGVRAGTAEAQLWGVQANENEPVLVTHDRYGHRIDEVEFHPAWHSLMTVAVSEGLAAPWSGATGAHVARAAGFYTWSQVEGGHGCPISMTSAVVPALRMQPDLATAYEPLLQSRTYDPGLRAPSGKAGLLAGMGMTEKQGGSDVRANTTRAVPDGDAWRLTGHKWFTSAPMCDLFLVLAQAPGGLSCFLVPRVLPDGTRNTFRIQRLKDKLGNRSNASSEPEFDNTVAWLVGEEGRGVRTIIEMVSMTRLDCVIGSAALMRAGVVQAIHHAKHRSAFGGLLVDKPAMQNVLADLALESEAATTLMLRLAGAVDREETAFKRLAVAVGKYWVTKRCPVFAGEALECLGGNGYVEESGMPRLYREAPLNSVWEGSGNVNALDVLRAMAREPESVEAFFAEIELADDARITAAVSDLAKDLGEADEVSARRLVEKLAMTLQASLLVRHAPSAVSDAYVASRIQGDWGSAFGTLPRGTGFTEIIERAAPRLP